MNDPRDRPRVARFFERLSVAIGIAIAIVALACLAIWSSGINMGMALYPGGVLMLPWSAVMFGLAGASTILLHKPNAPTSVRVIASLFAVLIVLIAGEQLAAWALHRDLGLDLVLFRQTVLEAPWRPPGRVAVNSALAFELAGLGLLAIHLDDTRDTMLAQWFGVGAALIGLLSLVGYAFGVSRLFAFTSNAGMAVTTAAAMTLLGVGVVFMRQRRGLPHLMSDTGAAGAVARRLVPAAIVVPFCLGWARIIGERYGWYDAGAGVSLYVVVTIAIFIWLVTWAAQMARESDLAREHLLAGAQSAREAAESANRSKSNFLAVMSHELRTPLSAIIGYEELLADEITGPINEAQKHQLGRMKASAQHLLHLIDQILAYSRIDAGREVVTLEDTDANSLALEACSLVEPLARDKGLSLEVVPTGTPIPIRTDVGKVRQILVNLVSNGVKFTPAGRVTIIVNEDGGEAVQYVVRDTGIGIAAEHSDRIFDAFWQVEQPSTRRAGGTGLGLSVTRRLARLLGGDVTVASRPGEGSAFTVTLPRVSPHDGARSD